ncbi:hypothetical protein LY90DRAFT_93534 [Neocallimastix californiae]|uniref:Uncharacterized protein n=1 Tax=Neocallimastix californiae TaxID=1754190 RepID=A0A1Y2F2E7_9FUNG|nr:hypothetical protein LY90DRAFT_93534 [Neocallimastix californiae]|eukprot:ORY77526.1 hypothetical protein LY90DRAFT_93534 [Neocallimastix californiae]
MVNNTINELKLKLMEKNNKNLNSNDTINDDSKTNLKNSLTSSDTIYKNSDSIDYLSSNPEVVIDINNLQSSTNNNDLSANLSSSNVQINNININDTKEENMKSSKKEITIDIDSPTSITSEDSKNGINEEDGKKRDVRDTNRSYPKRFKEINKNQFISDWKIKSSSHSSFSNSSLNSNKDQYNKYLNGKSKSEISLNSSNIGLRNLNGYKRFSSSNNNISLFENQNQAFLNKLIDIYSPQERLSVNFNHIYNPLFVSNNFSKRYDMELKYIDLSIKDIYEHGLPYLLCSKRPLIEFCKELIKEHQIEVLFFINEVCNFQKKLYTKPSDIFNEGKEIYNKYLGEHAICPLEVSQSLKMKCVKDLKCLRKECFHAISLFFYRNLDIIFEKFKNFVLKEHYENKTEFDDILITQKTNEEKKKIEDDLIKFVEIYYKSNDEELIKKEEFIIESIKKLCKSLLN